jgi:hypothetical protein
VARIGSSDYNRARPTQLLQRFSQSSRREQCVESDRIGRIQQDQIHVSMKREMLKPIIQNHTIDWMLL